MKNIEDAEARFVPIPETYSRRKLNSLYREIPLMDTAFRTMRKYFNAMANLYGVVSLEKAYEIISEQSPSLVTKDEFLAFAEIARHEREDYYILGGEDIYTDGIAGTVWEREIIAVTLFRDNLDLYLQTKQRQKGKPYYIPKKSQLLLYDDPFYCETTPAVSAMWNFLVESFELTSPQCEAVFTELLYGSRYLGADFSQVMNRLHDMGLDFKSVTDLREFVRLHQDFHNKTRMQCNRGHTPDEMFNLQPPEQRLPQALSLGPNIRKAIADGTMDAKELRQGILSMELPSEALRLSLLKEIADAEVAAKQKHKKVGRNEPCPCGSGKKYKHCCGR